MSFIATNSVGFLHASPSLTQGTCAWIGPRHILTASHCFWAEDETPTIVTGYTVNPGVNSAPGPYSVIASHYNQISDPNGDDQDIPHDFAIGLIDKPVTSWFGLNPTFVPASNSMITGYGFPEGGALNTWTEPLTQYGSAYQGAIQVEGGDSGGPAVSLWIPDGGSASIQTIAAICCAIGPSGALYCPVTPVVAQQIEIWQAQDGWSPVIDRLWRTFLGGAAPQAGHDYWAPQLVAPGTDYATQIIGMVPDFMDDCTGFDAGNPTALVAQLYTLVLGNVGSADLASGIAYWSEQIENGTLTPEKVVLTFVTHPAAMAFSGMWGQQ